MPVAVKLHLEGWRCYIAAIMMNPTQIVFKIFKSLIISRRPSIQSTRLVHCTTCSYVHDMHYANQLSLLVLAYISEEFFWHENLKVFWKNEHNINIVLQLVWLLISAWMNWTQATCVCLSWKPNNVHITHSKFSLSFYIQELFFTTVSRIVKRWTVMWVERSVDDW